MTTIARIGNAVSVEIPEDLLRQANLSVGDSVEWTLTETGTLVLKAAPKVDESAVKDGDEDGVRQKLEASFAEIKAGMSASEESVRDWIRSWDTDQELPPPL
jgi:antitoxin component of MazEF toxin-antitoxin module